VSSNPLLPSLIQSSEADRLSRWNRQQWIRQPEDHLHQGGCSRCAREARRRSPFYYRRTARVEGRRAEGESISIFFRVVPSFPQLISVMYVLLDGLPRDGTRLESVLWDRSWFVPSLLLQLSTNASSPSTILRSSRHPRRENHESPRMASKEDQPSFANSGARSVRLTSTRVVDDLSSHSFNPLESPE